MFLALRCPSSQRALPKTIDSILNELKPEAAYFAEENGKRTGFIFFDLKDTSQIPAVAEPWFLVNAQVEFHPAMNLEDLKKATPGIEKAVKPMHLLVILFIALLVFGPKKIPELGKAIGEGIRALREGLKEPRKSTSAETQAKSAEPGGSTQK